MDYKQIFRSNLLSKTNIDFLVSTILKNFKISQKAVPKCVNIITANLNKYLENIDRYPENNNELLEAMDFLNKKCYNDFTIYLSTKYPSINLSREHNEIPAEKIPETIAVQNTSQEIIILNEEEKNKLLKNFDRNEIEILSENKKEKNKIKQMTPDDFLSYLANPMVLQMFSTMISQLNQSTCTNTRKNEEIIIDRILDANQVQELISKYIQPAQIPNLNSTPEVSVQKKNTSPAVSDITIRSDDTIDIPKKNDEIINSIFDLSKGLNRDSLPAADKRIKELLELKNKYLIEKDMEMVEKIDNEKNQILDAVKTLKKELEKEAKENENKIKGISMSWVRNKNENDQNETNTEYLDLQFDPTNDYNDLKNIVIKFKTDNKITDITLVDYYLPFNSNNITRFNNKFIVYFNNRVHKILIPPGKYEINSLLEYIKTQVTFLDFTVSENKIITIKNSMNMKFDLWVDNDSIFPLLGFNGKTESYKEKLFYSASLPYDLSINDKIFFSLSGSTMEPLSLEFDKTIILNKSLKKSRSGIVIKQLILSFNNNIGQCYDFILPFKMCFKITYAA